MPEWVRDLKERERETKSDLFANMHYNNTTVDDMNKMCKGAYATLVSMYIIIVSLPLSLRVSLAYCHLRTAYIQDEWPTTILYILQQKLNWIFILLLSRSLPLSLCALQLGEKFKAQVVNFNFTTIHNWISKWNSETPAHTSQSTSAFECSHSASVCLILSHSLPSLAAASLTRSHHVPNNFRNIL